MRTVRNSRPLFVKRSGSFDQASCLWSSRSLSLSSSFSSFFFIFVSFLHFLETGKVKTPPPPNGHARILVNAEIYGRSLGGFFSNQRESISWCPKSPFPAKNSKSTNSPNFSYVFFICRHYDVCDTLLPLPLCLSLSLELSLGLALYQFLRYGVDLCWLSD